MHPQLRQFTEPPMQTSQAAIDTFWNGQLYLVVGEQGDGGRWLIRMWWKPFVTLIWLGGAMIAAGGGLSLLGRVRRDIRSEEHTSELQSLMRISYAVFCLNKKINR